MRPISLSIFLTFLPFFALAQTTPIRVVEDLWSPKAETMVGVASARIILADYDLIRRDFTHTKPLTDHQIDQWLLRETAFVSSAQAQQKLVNSSIPGDGRMRIGQRPKEYRRGIVFEVEGGMIDAKGTGSLNPTQGSHDNGLATLGEMIREYIYENLVRRLFSASQSKYTTVASYAVIDFGFNIVHEDSSTSRAGYILRQAHTRRNEWRRSLHQQNPYMAIQLDGNKAIEVESLLRRFGITTAGGNRRTLNYDLINVQGTKEGAIVDFGAFLAMQNFTRLVRINGGNNNYDIHVWQKSELKQPQADLVLPFHIWGSSVSGLDDPKADNPYRWSHELADSLAKGTATRADALNHFHNLLDPVDKILVRVKQKNCSALF